MPTLTNSPSNKSRREVKKLHLLTLQLNTSYLTPVCHRTAACDIIKMYVCCCVFIINWFCGETNTKLENPGSQQGHMPVLFYLFFVGCCVFIVQLFYGYCGQLFMYTENTPFEFYIPQFCEHLWLMTHTTSGNKRIRPPHPDPGGKGGLTSIARVHPPVVFK